MQTLRRTLLSVFWEKFLDTVEGATWSEIFVAFSRVFCFLVISYVLINIRDFDGKIVAIVKYESFAILKVSFVFLLVFYSRAIYNTLENALYWILENFKEEITEETHGPLYSGIPIVELVDYLFTASSYSRTDFCEYFAVSRKVFDDLASGLDNIGVFVRGKNNARVISPEYSRSDISSILTRASETGEIRPLIRETGKGYSHVPSMPEIIDRAHSPTHGFTTRPLHS